MEGIISHPETHTTLVDWLEVSINLAQCFLEAKTEGITIYS